MNIPFLGIDRFYKGHSEEILNTINKVYSGGHLLMGSEVGHFEEHVAALCHRKFGASVGNCTDALYFALLSSGVNKGDEVLVTCFSYIASVTPILRIGAIPVFVDIDNESYMMDLSDLKNKITDKTKAIVGVHLFGQMLPFDQLNTLASAHDLTLIEDAAQSLGSKYKDNPAGSLGLCSCISFDPTKIIGAFGSGGILLTDEEEIYKKVKKLRFHGKNDETGKFDLLGYNSRLATSPAALLNLQLKKLEGWINRRNEIASIYTSELEEIEEIDTPQILNGNSHIFHKYVIRTAKRDELRNHLTSNGIQTQVHYQEQIYNHGLFNNYDYRAEGITIAPQISGEVLSLPIYPELETNEVKYICDCIKGYFQ